MRKVAMVTGATRGIGKACALSLAKAGYDIAVTGRTLREGDGKVPSASAKDPRELAVPGSIETTVTAVRALGREALGLQLDILSRASIDQVLDQVLQQWGRVDVLVNNAIYQGPGLMYRFTEFTQEQLDACLLGILVNQVHITRRLLPVMVQQGGGTVVCIGSVAGVGPPPVPPAKGGWGFLYGASKSGFHRMAEYLHLEHKDDGIRSFLVEPQMTVTDTMARVFGEGVRSLVAAGRAFTPEITGEVVAWLVSHPEADAYAGRLLSTPTFFKDNGITPGA
ncbi:MAG: SDR family oxidoreductase [Proteobacteria bacterium]|nr:SDR family oxidoreductase [Pseudomonadota bacterium]